MSCRQNLGFSRADQRVTTDQRFFQPVVPHFPGFSPFPVDSAMGGGPWRQCRLSAFRMDLAFRLFNRFHSLSLATLPLSGFLSLPPCRLSGGRGRRGPFSRFHMFICRARGPAGPQQGPCVQHGPTPTIQLALSVSERPRYSDSRAIRYAVGDTVLRNNF